MASVQSSLVPLELSFDGGATWQILVCITQYNIPLERATNVTETFCGTETGLGSLTFNPSFTAVTRTDLSSNMVTYDRILDAIVNSELIQFRSQYPTAGSVGVYWYLKGSAYVTSLDKTFQVGQTVQFTGTLTGTGDIDVTP